MKSTAIALAFALSAVAALAQAPAPLAPKIVCAEPIFDFGERENSETVEHHYVVRNEGTLSLEIRGIRATCGCTVAKPDDELIPPGGQTKIQARLDLRGRSGMQIKTISVLSNDPQTPTLNLQMRGTAVQGLRAEPSTLFFGRVGPGGVRTRSFAIVSGRGPFQVLEVRPDQTGLSVRPLDPEPGDDGALHRFELTLDDSIPAGTLNTRLQVRTDLGADRDFSIPVAAFIATSSPP